MFAIPTVIAAFAPLWIALLVALSMLAFSLGLIADTLRKNQELANV
jgi:hypothetical protein